ncbi:MAG: 50S ribosomal protein L23 [Thermoguttaceae bacterium]|nr:50S ribosomal protein L23 [Thermoguttaceae bacterium]
MAQSKDVTITKLKLEPYQVIIRPIATEKGYHNATTTRNCYTFEVHKLASKGDIKEAIESLFSVRVVAVATQNRKGKKRRTKRVLGETKSWKKAMVTLHDDDRIDIF